MSNFRRRVGVALAAPLLFGACGHHDADRASTNDVQGVKLAARDSARVLGPGDVQIVSSDSAVELAIVGDTVIGGLGTKVLDKVRGETDTNKVKGNDFGANIEKMVKQNVADALSHQMLVPVSSIREVTYSDGTLHFRNNNGSEMHVFESSSKGGHDHTTFDEADAQRFIAAFDARKRSSGGNRGAPI
ncbi:MAG TPA: hypothetical protein VGM67_00135 [Gemmatimonadaceae bacterium]